ncbi:sigma-54-dependent transcriptional regulator [Opitutus terrae]|uniref:Putative two component, sigma54 specific, transcriptional regulator, Fis family n=1 Tax=Opitutus terrae (strain DSM 11246 / JCM 15787 / PB90-1) TaxID=452637 RepID=B1ZWK8_OPITP|nr:sigma-54 dependent transcriptional regulator [Opitutus terrae]ACB73332.1 putative two component, sigma54 specific, transcriptional regulator, Fis family [Opitutus terrae PB90-1]
MKLVLIGSESQNRRLVSLGLHRRGDETCQLTRRAELARLPALREWQVVLLDWDLRTDGAAELLRELHERDPELPVVAIVTNPSAAAQARTAGATETVFKPINIDEGRALLQRVARAAKPAASAAEPAGDTRFITQSAAMEQVLAMAWRVAPTSASVLLLGENGTGKSMLARAVHEHSTRANGPFINVNCPCLQPQLLESELFGHVRGAFTGAVSDAVGKVAAAEGGTLFLDEVGELPPEIQAKLLRLLQERCYERLGEAQTRRADIRVIAATNRDLRQRVAAGAFREDLYYRLNVITIEMPSLRGRPEDIVPLAEHFLETLSQSAGGPRRRLTLAAREALVAHSWPGNLRELRNLVERAAILCDREWLDATDFPELLGRTEPGSPQVGEFVTLEALIEAHIRQVTARAESYEQAARILGIDKSTLYRWRKRFENFDPTNVEAFVG